MEMKKRLLILVTVLTVTLLFAMFSAVSAQPGDTGASRCDLDITYDVYGDGEYWLGSISGEECSVAGAIRFDAVDEEYFDAGKSLHFVEEFTIWPGSEDQTGDWIKGKNCGVWNLTTFNYRAHGWVTEVSDDQMAYLIGSQYHEMGTTGNPDDGLPLLAPGGRATLTPGNRRVDPLPNHGLCPPPQEGE
jgi:hypothetical protein